MVEIRQNDRNYEYDIYSLVKAFYPQNDVETFVEGDNRVNDKHAEIVVNIIYDLEGVAIKITEAEKEYKDYAKCDFGDRKGAKNILKRTLYQLLVKVSNRELPWGTLTGIRPTKIPMNLIEQGYDEEYVVEYMKNTYLASDEKVRLSIEIAKKEIEVLKDIDYKNGYSIYIGIPFCPTTCLYCSFTSYPLSMWEKRMDEYVDALCKEIEYTAEAFKNKKLNTIYIGGGTPTTLNPNQLDMILTKIEDLFDFTYIKEFTVEAGRPDSITLEKLEVLKKHNITRISINPQTMNQKTLDIIGRKHSVLQVKEAFEMARELGFNNINMDLIVGLPNENMEEVRYTMEEINKLNPDSVTVHSLAIKRAARLNMFKDKYKELSINNTREIIDLTARYVAKIGAKPYYLYRQKNMAGNFENVGYSKQGCECIYNILIMEEKQTIIALGAGASTKVVFPDDFTIKRIENVKDVASYIERIDEMIQRKKDFFDTWKLL